MHISYLVLALGSLVLLGVGWLVGKSITSKGFATWKKQSEDLTKENSNLNKKLKKETNQVECHRQRSDEWKREFQALTQDTQQLKKDQKAKIASLEEQMTQLRTQSSQFKTQGERLETSKEKLRKEHEKLKEKYARDVLAGENWRTERQKLEREFKDSNSRLEKMTMSSNDYQKKYEKQAEQINQIRVMEREMRLLKTKLNKAEQDCTYWEKKHYDTHHELAELKKSTESMDSKYKELEELRKGDEILRNNLLQQVAEFKSKFVNINNKYRDLVSQ